MKRNPQAIEVESPAEAPKKSKKMAKNGPKSDKKSKKTTQKVEKVLLFSGIVGILAGIVLILSPIWLPKEVLTELTFPTIPAKKPEEAAVYSNLTGEVLASASEISGPAYCIQIPNGTDGGRPQAGLTQAGVVFEAIAEAGITRFAAIFQDPTTAIIGPIRSLRLYYLEWDTPFDCTIVHAGGADDAIAAVRNGGYKDLTENYNYMYRGTAAARRWNNLFTTATDLREFANDRGYTGSDIKGFLRLAPDAAVLKRVEETAVEFKITEPADYDTSEFAAKVMDIAINFGYSDTFNVRYHYDAATNAYKRSYASGAAHNVYACADADLGERNPEDVCKMEQVSPAVVVAMVVNERKASDNYHENITTTGSGEAYIFQNGVAIHGRWVKNSRGEQIRFYDEAGTEVALVPGQAFVSAVPSYGSVEY